MKLNMRSVLFTGLTLLLTGGCQSETSSNDDLAQIDKAIVDATLNELVDTNMVMGASALIYHGGEEIYYGQSGMADLEADQVWRRDTLANIYSMTKPITGVTLMSLYEEGLFDLEAPLADYLPEYANVKVFKEVGEDGLPILEAPNRPIKVIDIFRHTACFGYNWGDHPIAAMMTEADVLNPAKTWREFSEGLSELPLYCHPGSQWKYSVSVDVQARLAEAVTGRRFKDLLQERVLGPLGMRETTGFVEADQRSRLSAIYNTGEEGGLTRVPNEFVYGFATEKPARIGGGSGLISTADDYMRFALMLQNEGTFDGVQILKPETIALMSRDHLPDGLTDKDFLPGKGQMGFGLDFAVRIAPPVNDKEPYGVVGEFFWDGAPSTLFWVDPKNDLTVVFLTQVFPFNSEAQAIFRRAVYDALDL